MKVARLAPLFKQNKKGRIFIFSPTFSFLSKAASDEYYLKLAFIAAIFYIQKIINIIKLGTKIKLHICMHIFSHLFVLIT
jgi:hypothetical protein